MLFDTEEALSDRLLKGKAYKQLGIQVPNRDGATFRKDMENLKGSVKADGFHTKLVSAANAPIN